MRLEIDDIGSSDVFDFCIIGTGPAGISCALALSKTGKKILLLEGGTDEITEKSQEIYKGTVIGDPYFDLDVTRLRYFGGSSNHWGGWCRTLDSADFKKKGNYDTEWPISRKDLDVHLKKALSILEIPDIPDDQPIGDSGLNKVKFVYSPLVRFLGKYFDHIVAHKNIFLILNANVTSLETSGSHITNAYIKDFSGKEATIKAQYFVLATGGIENSRLLLWSNELSNGQVVKKAASLGRYWMEHPHFTIGTAFMATDSFDNSENSKRLFISPTLSTMVKNNTLNCGLRLNIDEKEGAKKIIKSIACVAPDVGRWAMGLLNKDLICGFQIRAAWEQEPVASNHIALGNDKDSLGIPRINLHWRKNETDLRTVRETALTLGEYVAKNNIGRIHLNDWVFGDADYPEDDEWAGNHHLGGTRMAAVAEKGIVDKNCKVFGQSNLYVAGSSIFPSGGHCNPTLSIVQLALRLGTHLRNVS